MAENNPIIPGFAPDPSIVAVDGTFYLVNSSFHIFPGLPIYASRNLVEWKHIGNAINRRQQFDPYYSRTSISTLDTGFPLIATGGLFAPTIRYNQGIIYIVCTNVYHDEGLGNVSQNFIIFTKDIWSDTWSDPVLFDFNGIDPSLFFDYENRAFIQGCWALRSQGQPRTTIKQVEIDIHTGELLSHTKEIWAGFARYDPEGPHMYLKDGYYYLLIAEGGTFEHHMLSIARSKSIWGPFESYVENPILTADGTKEYIQNVGHGDLFQDAAGEWWAVVLGVRNRHNRFPLGRETFLTRASWPTGEWPKIETPKVLIEKCQVGSNLPKTLSHVSSSEVHARVDDVYISVSNEVDNIINSDGSSVTMKARREGLSCDSGTGSFYGKRQRKLNCVVYVTLMRDKRHLGLHLKAGLTIFKDRVRHGEIFYDYFTSTLRYSSRNESTGWEADSKAVYTEDGPLDLMIEATALAYVFSYRNSQGEAVKIGLLDTIEMTGRDFTGPIFGLFAQIGGGITEDSEVAFSGFSIKELSDVD